MIARISNPLTGSAPPLSILSYSLCRLEHSSLSHTLYSGFVVHAVWLSTHCSCVASVVLLWLLLSLRPLLRASAQKQSRFLEDFIGGRSQNAQFIVSLRWVARDMQCAPKLWDHLGRVVSDFWTPLPVVNMPAEPWELQESFLCFREVFLGFCFPVSWDTPS